MRGNRVLFAAGAVAGLVMIRKLRPSAYNLSGKSVVITGGSRGLGLVIARECVQRGARIAIIARDREELARATQELHEMTNELIAIPADVTIREEAELAVDRVRHEFGAIDVLVNNAGTITVGPIDMMTAADYRDSLNTHFWGPYFMTTAVLRDMKTRHQGRIVNISSIGGKLSVPHLLPYSVGKFALTGFSEGLRAELRKDNILVTTVCPGLMRTGSPRNASFKGKNELEYAWFSISDALPLVSISAKRAARSIVNACIHGDAEVLLSVPARLAVMLHGAFPGLAADLLSMVNRLLPAPGGIGREVRTGKESTSRLSPSLLTTLNERAAAENNEVA